MENILFYSSIQGRGKQISEKVSQVNCELIPPPCAIPKLNAAFYAARLRNENREAKYVAAEDICFVSNKGKTSRIDDLNSFCKNHIGESGYIWLGVAVSCAGGGFFQHTSKIPAKVPENAVAIENLVVDKAFYPARLTEQAIKASLSHPSQEATIPAVPVIFGLEPLKVARERAFTLVEVLIATVIIALLAAVAVPALKNAKSKSSEKAEQCLVKTLNTGITRAKYIDSVSNPAIEGASGSTAEDAVQWLMVNHYVDFAGAAGTNIPPKVAETLPNLVWTNGLFGRK